MESKAKSYHREKLWLTLINFIVTLGLLLLAIFAGITVWFRNLALSFSDWDLISVSAYFTLFSLYFLIADYPLAVYSGYWLEKKYELSDQSFWSWVRENAKKSVLSFALALVLVEIFFFLVRRWPGDWWWMIWIVWVLFTLVLGRLAPVLIFPLFYKFKPLENADLEKRIHDLVESGGLKLENVYVFDLSKTTKKANAAFCGMGKTQRVILADTLIQNFTPEEIEVVVAHEMGHCKLKHLWKRLGWGMAVSLAGFFIAYEICRELAPKLGYGGLGDLASLPLVFLVFLLFGLLAMPFENSYSRKHEYEADAFAVKTSKERSSFVPLMEKLARLNLADLSPHPVIEFVLYDHPSIQHRIERYQSRNA